MKKTRICAHCGKEFLARRGMQKYCCEECKNHANDARKNKRRSFLTAVEPLIDLGKLEYLTFAKAALLMGCSRQYIYKIVREGKLPASRLSSRMSLIRKTDIEKMLEGNPYHRVLPADLQSQEDMALHYEADHIRYESARMHFQDIEGIPEYFQYLDSVYCIPENVEKRKIYWEKTHIAH